MCDMCTAVSFRRGVSLFGRTLDNDKSFNEEFVATPRSFPLWRGGGEHFAILGMATVKEGLPLYYDGMNERGLCMAGLNFDGNAGYSKPKSGALNIAQYEFLPYILGTCSDVSEAERLIKTVNLTDEPFSPSLPPAPLHWMLSDGKRDIVAECIGGHMRVYENPAGVLTNNPPFESQLLNLANYMSLSPGEGMNTFSEGLDLKPYCCGLGAFGLPGDYSSMSRFVRAAFVRGNYLPAGGEGARTMFGILSSVIVPRGCCRANVGWQTTLYACAMHPDRGEYGYVTGAGQTPVTFSFGSCNGGLFRHSICS